METLMNRIEQMETKMNAFISDARKTTNKSAAMRARKLSLEITKELKDFRKDSIK